MFGIGMYLILNVQVSGFHSMFLITQKGLHYSQARIADCSKVLLFRYSLLVCLLQNPYHVRQGDSVRQSSSWGLFRQSQKPINQKIWNDHSRQEVHQLTGLSEAHPHCRSLSNTVSKFYDPITGHLGQDSPRYTITVFSTRITFHWKSAS